MAWDDGGGFGDPVYDTGLVDTGEGEMSFNPFNGDTSDSSMQNFDGFGNVLDPYQTAVPDVNSPIEFPSNFGDMAGSAISGLGSGLGAGIPWGGLLQLMGGIQGYTTSQEGIGMTKDLISKADPWGTSGGRGMAEGELMSMMGQGGPQAPNPYAVSSLPGYQAGMDAVQRSMASNGYIGSGNMMASMMQYGGQAYQNAFNNYISESQLWNQKMGELGGFAGANVTPNGDAPQLLGVLGQAEASKNASYINGLTGLARALTPQRSAAPAAAPSGGGGGGGGDGGFGSFLGEAASLIGAFL